MQTGGTTTNKSLIEKVKPVRDYQIYGGPFEAKNDNKAHASQKPSISQSQNKPIVNINIERNSKTSGGVRVHK